MATTDTQLQQLVINVGTEAQIANAIAGGTITNDMLSIATDGADISYDWIGTLAEYNTQQIATLHPDWLCFITDDVNNNGEDVYANIYSKTTADNIFVAKGHEVVAFQAPTAANNYTWYRRYADGWVEMGARRVSAGTVTLDASQSCEVPNHWIAPLALSTLAGGNANISGNSRLFCADVYVYGEGHEFAFWIVNTGNAISGINTYTYDISVFGMIAE